MDTVGHDGLVSALSLQRHDRWLRGYLGGSAGNRRAKHCHVGTVQGYTLQGTWRYLQHDWIATSGSFNFEPAGEAHTLVEPDTATQPAIILFMVSGALVYVDEEGAFSIHEVGFTILKLAREYYRSEGPDLSHVDAMIR